MTRLLAYHSPSAGNTFPAIDMLVELRRRGHEVSMRVRQSDVEPMEALGLRATPIDPRIEKVEFDDWRGRSQVGSLLRLLRAYRACAELEIPDLQRAIAELDPEALIVDVNCEGAMYVAEAARAFRWLASKSPDSGLGDRSARDVDTQRGFRPPSRWGGTSRAS